MASSGWQGQRDFPFNHQNIKADLNITSITHNGTSLRVVGQIGARGVNMSSGGTAWYYYPVYVTPEGGSEMTLLSGYETVAQGAVKTVNFDVTVSVGASDTNHTFTVYVRMNNNTATGTLSWNINFDTSSSAPTVDSITNITTTGMSVTWTNTEGLAAVSFLYYSNYYSGGNTWYWMLGDGASGSATRTYNFTYGIPNRRYYFYGSGTQKGDSKSAVTKPPVVVAGISNMYSDSVKVECQVPEHGGEYALSLQYRVNNGSWQTASTVVEPGYHAATTVPITVGNLVAGNFYTIDVRTTTAAGTTNGTGVTFLFQPDSADITLYGSVNGMSTGITKLYGSVQGQTKKVKKLYGSVNGTTKLLYQTATVPASYGYAIFYTDDSKTTTDYVIFSSQSDVNALAPSSAASTWTATIGGKTLKNTLITTVSLGKSTTSLPNLFLYYCTALTTIDLKNSSITTIGDNVLSYCTAITSRIVFPNTLTSIGTNFMSVTLGAVAFSSEIVLPANIQHIGTNFCYGMNANYTLVVGDVPATVADQAAANPDTSGSFSCFSIGAPTSTGVVSVEGSTAQAWLTRFPNFSNSTPGTYFTTYTWRNLRIKETSGE